MSFMRFLFFKKCLGFLFVKVNVIWGLNNCFMVFLIKVCLWSKKINIYLFCLWPAKVQNRLIRNFMTVKWVDHEEVYHSEQSFGILELLGHPMLYFKNTSSKLNISPQLRSQLISGRTRFGSFYCPVSSKYTTLSMVHKSSSLHLHVLLF